MAALSSTEAFLHCFLSCRLSSTSCSLSHCLLDLGGVGVSFFLDCFKSSRSDHPFSLASYRTVVASLHCSLVSTTKSLSSEPLQLTSILYLLTISVQSSTVHSMIQDHDMDFKKRDGHWLETAHQELEVVRTKCYWRQTTVKPVSYHSL